MKKNTFVKGLFGLGFVIVFSAACVSKNVDDSIEDETETILRICVSESDKNTYLNDVLTAYSEKYPEVNVEWDLIPSDKEEEEKDRIASELMAGDGADLYFNVEYLLMDPYKAQKSGVFADLKPLLEEFAQLQEGDFIDGTFDIMEDGEECYILPAMNSISMSMIRNSVLDELGIDLETWDNILDYNSGVQDFYKKYPEGSPFLLGENGLFSINYFGFKIWNKESAFSVLKSPEWKENLDLMKEWLFPEGNASSAAGYEDYTQYENERESFFRNEITIFVKRATDIYGLEDYIRMGGESEAKLIPDYDINGNIQTYGLNGIAISESSDNKEQAVQFIKEILQNLEDSTLRSSNDNVLEEVKEEYGKQEVIIDGITYDGLTENTFTTIEQWLDHAVVTFPIPGEVSSSLNDYYEQYWKNEITYEQCIKNCIEFMEIYYSE